MGYWEQRASDNEDKAQRLAASYSKRQEKLYKDAYKKINNTISALQNEIAANGAENITRTELWRYQKYIDLRNLIEKELGIAGQKQISILDDMTKKVFQNTLETTLKDLPHSDTYNMLSKQQIGNNLNTAWSGANYSQRVWTNTNHLAQTLDKKITDMLTLGKMPQEIKTEIMRQMNVSYNVADRLIRTEASHVYNTAAIEGYKQSGITEVEFIAEDDCCDDCAQYSGQTFQIGTEPMLPIHPNCRCCYAPVVEL